MMFRIYLLSIVTILFGSCDSKPEQITVLSGHIPMDITEVIHIWNGNYKDTIQTTKGDFSKEIKVSEPGFYRISIANNRYEIYLEPGKNLSIHIDSLSNPLNIHFSEGLAAENDYLEKVNSILKINYRELFTLPLDSFQMQLDSLYESCNHIASTDFEGLFSPTFKEIIPLKLKASQGDRLLRYPRYHGYYTKTDEPEMPEGYYDFIDKIDINLEPLFNIYDIRSYISSLVGYRSQQIIKAGEIDKDREDAEILSKVMAAKKYISNENIQNKVMYEELADRLGYYGPAHIDEAIQFFNANCTDTALTNKIANSYKEWEHLKPGKEAPYWEAKDINGEPVNITNFRGKYLYMDIWATWCGPCRREIPYLEELIKKYEGTDVAFVSVSIDKDKAAWEKMVTNDNMIGNQLYADGAFKSALALDYKVNAIPRFFLIDPQGLIINVSTERPSGKIEEILNSYLGITE